MAKRITIFVYGLVSYLLFLATFLYAAGFVGNLWVPKSLDSGPAVPMGQALLTDTLLLALFALQHSVMARRGFKALWTTIVPEPAERSTYVLFSSLALAFLFWKWQPIGGVLWTIDGAAGQVILHGIFALGLLIVLVSTFMINHFDLFGLRQVSLYLVGKPYTPSRFATPFFYRYVRHPLYFGWLLFFWATPVMTFAHFLFALMTTSYILIAIQLEERDLIAIHGEEYRRYRRHVPMILPFKGAIPKPLERQPQTGGLPTI